MPKTLHCGHHLVLAGTRSDTLFCDDVAPLAHQVSRGLPRMVNNLVQGGRRRQAQPTPKHGLARQVQAEEAAEPMPAATPAAQPRSALVREARQLPYSRSFEFSSYQLNGRSRHLTRSTRTRGDTPRAASASGWGTNGAGRTRPINESARNGRVTPIRSATRSKP